MEPCCQTCARPKSTCFLEGRGWVVGRVLDRPDQNPEDGPSTFETCWVCHVGRNEGSTLAPEFETLAAESISPPNPRVAALSMALDSLQNALDPVEVLRRARQFAEFVDDADPEVDPSAAVAALANVLVECAEVLGRVENLGDRLPAGLREQTHDVLALIATAGIGVTHPA